MAATFKNEKQRQEWLAANPKAAARVQAGDPAASKPQLATSDGVTVVARLPRRAAAPARRRSFWARFDVVMAWFFLATVGLSLLGIVACTSAILALEYLR